MYLVFLIVFIFVLISFFLITKLLQKNNKSEKNYNDKLENLDIVDKLTEEELKKIFEKNLDLSLQSVRENGDIRTVRINEKINKEYI